MSFRPIRFLFLLLFLRPGCGFSYPLDQFRATGIERLEGYFHAVKKGGTEDALPAGALLAADAIVPNLPESSFSGKEDAAFSAELRAILAPYAGAYGIAVLDMSNPAALRYGAVNGDLAFEPGSAGKVVVALALFHELQKRYPESLSARARLLRERRITADEYIISDAHEVPFWVKDEAESGRIELRELRLGETANLWTFLDWMLSASSNAAASMVMRELVLLRSFGSAYPPDAAAEKKFLATTSAAEKGRLLAQSIDEALRSNELNPARLRQGSLFTKTGKQKIQGSGSTATPAEFMKLLVRMEQGRLVDYFSSVELKRLLYLTQTRSRYAAAPELGTSAVYIKSGSSYSCRYEAGYTCEKYLGNVKNILNAVAVVEDESLPRAAYAVVLSTNVLRVKADDLHAKIAGEIHLLMKKQRKKS